MMPADTLMLADDMADFYHDPLGFVRYAFDWGVGDLSDWPGPDQWQIDFLTALRDAIRTRAPGAPIRMAAKTGRGVGKTALEAWLILWLMSTRPNFAGIATANTGDQLDAKLWRELAMWHGRAINGAWFQWNASRFAHREAPKLWGIDAVKWREEAPDALGGLHNAGRGQAAIIDEGSGIPGPIIDVIEATMTDPDSFVFIFGNPLRKSGRFHEIFTRFAHRWLTFTVDARTSRIANQHMIEQAIEDYGIASDHVRRNVLGEFPETDEQTLIPLPLIEAARTREVMGCDDYRPVWGLDVARFGDDRTALCIRRHRKVETIEAWRGLDTMQTAGRIKALWDAAAPVDRPTMIVVDVIGIGAGVVDRLREMELPVRGLNVSEMPAIREKFHRLRDEMWWKGREWFERRDVHCEDRALGAELADVLFGYASAGQIRVERKQDIKDRLGRSPDIAEAFLLSLMEDCERAETPAAGDRYARARARLRDERGSAWAT